MDLLALTIQCMVVKKIVLSQQMKKIRNQYLKRVRLIVPFFYHTYKGEGARKIQPRIKRFYTGISIKRIQKWLNSNENHFKINPIFSNKLPLSPVVSKTVQGCNQIDLVDMRSMSVTKNDVEFNYNNFLSLLDVFSRFLELRPLSSKDSNEVLTHLRGIFR